MRPPPGPPSCFDIRRPRKNHTPKKRAIGISHERMSGTIVFSNRPAYSTPCSSSSFARSCSTREVTNRRFPSTSSLYSPWIWSAETTTFATLSSRTSFWKWLYGIVATACERLHQSCSASTPSAAMST